MSVQLNRIQEFETRPTEPSQTQHVADDLQEQNAQILPPVDAGPKAYRFLFGCFMIEAILWGFPLTFGIFQNYYSQQPEFRNNSNIAVIGTVAGSIQFMGAPFSAPLIKRFQPWRQQMVAFGFLVCVFSLVAASFAKTVSVLIATQGAMYGVGFWILYFPLLSMLNEWFVQRRGLAYGIVFAGGGFSGICLPFLVDWLLSKHGFRTALRITAIAEFVAVAPVLPLLKGRLPASHTSVAQTLDTSFVYHPLFWVFTISNLCQGFGYYVPSLYLPTFASALGLSGTMGALVLAANNVATVGGQLAFGHLSDRYENIHLLAFTSAFVSSVAAFTIWGYANSLATLLVFACIYGWFAGAWVVLWPKFASIVSRDPQAVYSLLSLGKGIGNIATGPISAHLITQGLTPGYGLGVFKQLVIYLGTTMLCSSFGILSWKMKSFSTRLLNSS